MNGHRKSAPCKKNRNKKIITKKIKKMNRIPRDKSISGGGKTKLNLGFTIIEVLVVIAIIGILSAVVSVSLSSYRNSGNSTRANGELNSAVASAANCWAFGGKVKQPASGENICSLGSTYGQWPMVSNYNFSYEASPCVDCSSLVYFPIIKNADEKRSTSSWASFLIHPASAAAGPPADYCVDKNADWYFSAKNLSGTKKICCNKKMKGCKTIDTTCDASVN
jgi:prepilin-type N-terminal cleavage/methylation domain-containing protein